MAYVPRVPRPVRSADGDNRSMRADLARIERRRYQPPPKMPLVGLGPERSTDWGPGKAWLQTEEPGA